LKCAFIQAHQAEFRVRAMCRVLRVHFSGFYAWLKESLSHRALEDARQTELNRQAWSVSGSVYDYRKLTDDLRDQGETCSENRVARLVSLVGITARIGYKRRPGRYGGKPALVVTNTLDRQFEVDAPDKVWVTDITYIKTQEGWLYLPVVIDLFSRHVVGWSVQPGMTTHLALQTLLAAVWRRKPKTRVMIHSDQGSQFTSCEWQLFLSQHNLDASITRRGNCHNRALRRHWFKPNGEGGRGKLLPTPLARTHPTTHLVVAVFASCLRQERQRGTGPCNPCHQNDRLQHRGTPIRPDLKSGNHAKNVRKRIVFLSYSAHQRFAVSSLASSFTLSRSTCFNSRRFRRSCEARMSPHRLGSAERVRINCSASSTVGRISKLGSRMETV
jgi:putative transposase